MKRTLLITAVIVALGVASFFAYQQWFSSIPPESPAEIDEPDRTINYDPPTQEEIEQTEDFKEKKSSDEDDNREPVDMHVALNNFGQDSSDGSVFANATVGGIKEGQCRFVFKKDNEKVSKTAAIERAPTGYYACGVIVDEQEFSPKGEWSAQVIIVDSDPQVASEVKSTEIQ